MIFLLFQTPPPAPAAEASNVAIWLAIIAGVVAIITAYFKVKENRDLAAKDAEINRLTVLQAATETSLKMAKQEINLDSYALSFSAFMEHWNEIAAKLNELFTKTKTSRFLILRAWNGMESPRYTTAIIQYRQGRAEFSDYIHFELDDDYVQKLLRTRRKKICVVETSAEGDTAIGGVYRAEHPPVTHALWYHIKDERVDSERVIVTYCSFATSDEVAFTKEEEIKHRLLVNIIQEKFDGETWARTTR